MARTPPNPLKADPTRTLTLRRTFLSKLRKRFALLAKDVRRLVAEQDVFGLGRRSPGAVPGLAFNASAVPNVPRATPSWRFLKGIDQIRMFRAWLKETVRSDVLGEEERRRWAEYVDKGHAKGMSRAWQEARAAGVVREPPNADLPSVLTGEVPTHQGQAPFVRGVAAKAQATAQRDLLLERTWADLEGVTEAMINAMVRTLTDGLMNGLSPEEVADELERNINGIGRARAEGIARTDLVRSHAAGELFAFEELGVTHVTILLESAAGGGPCPLCDAYEDEVLSLEEATGILPIHPNCRCAWVPAQEPDEDEQDEQDKEDLV